MGSGLQMVQGLVSGELDATLPNVSEAQSMISDGSIRPLAVMAKERLADYPDVPTTWELATRSALRQRAAMPSARGRRPKSSRSSRRPW